MKKTTSAAALQVGALHGGSGTGHRTPLAQSHSLLKVRRDKIHGRCRWKREKRNSESSEPSSATERVVWTPRNLKSPRYCYWHNAPIWILEWFEPVCFLRANKRHFRAIFTALNETPNVCRLMCLNREYRLTVGAFAGQILIIRNQRDGNQYLGMIFITLNKLHSLCQSFKNNLYKYNFHVLYLSISMFCYFILPPYYIYLIHWVTLQIQIIQLLQVFNSDNVSGKTLCERMLHQSQLGTFFGSKTCQKNLGYNNWPGPIISIPLKESSCSEIKVLN